MQQHALAARPVLRSATAWLALPVAAALAWFALPVLGSTANEGFQATIAITAHALLHGGQGSLAAVDPLHGLNNDFMVHSRFGVSAALAGLMALGLPWDGAFRLIMAVSLGALVGANAALLSWRYRVHPLWACVPALLFPGLFESAWFFNDNVLSAALSSLALLVFWRGASLPASAGAGVLWGLAVACRTDAVLLAPAFAVLAWFTLPGWQAWVRHALVAGPLAVAVPVAVYGAFGLNILDILPLTRQATTVWARQDTWAHVLLPFVKGFALPGMLAITVGAAWVLWRRQWLEVLLCLMVPLLYVAAYGRMLTEVRYLLPLTPMFGILMAEACRAVQFAGPRARGAAWAAFAAALALCFSPVDATEWRPLAFMAADHDMPRPFPGRFWSPAYGMWWNRTLDSGTAALARELDARTGSADALAGRPVLVVSTYWTPDRSVALLLRERGFVLAQAGLPAACQGIAERFVRGSAAVTHLRAHLPMAPSERSAINWEVEGLPCVQAQGVSAGPVLVAGWTPLREPPAGLAAPGVRPLHVPLPSANRFARALTSGRYAYYAAEATLAAVPALLQAPADDAERAAAKLALQDAKLRQSSWLVR